jgi:tripartite ATP-independent transporter DctP family solute receptor
MLKKSLVLALLCIVTMSFAFANGTKETTSASSADKVYELKLAHYVPAEHPGGVAAQQFADNVKKRTNGKVIIDVYPNNELGAPDEILEQNIEGVVDFSLGTQGSLCKYSKKFATVMMPFVFDDYDHAYKVLDGPFTDWVKGDLEEIGLEYIGSWDYGFRNLTNSVRPINTPADVKGLKIRTPGEIQLQSCIEAMGANVQAISFNELYLSLKQGTVDGQENPLSVIYYNKFYEAQKYLAMTGHVYNSMNLVVSEKVWTTLPADYQQIIREESKNAAVTMRDLIKNGDAEYIKNLEAEGMIVTYPDKAAFKALMKPSYDKIAKYVGSQEVIDEFLKMVDASK